ncbi:hypothetical protein DFH06DRAFT_978849, partial [Mycena polygramma]
MKNADASGRGRLASDRFTPSPDHRYTNPYLTHARRGARTKHPLASAFCPSRFAVTPPIDGGARWAAAGCDYRRCAPLSPSLPRSSNDYDCDDAPTENFLPKIDGSTITISHLLQHLNETGVQAMLFGPESGMTEYAGAKLFGTYGVPLAVYPGLKINFISPAFLSALRAFRPHVIHLVDPIWLGVQSLAALQFLSSMWRVPIVTSHHTNLPTYAAVFGYPYFHHRTWAVHAYLHSFARYTLVPSASTAVLLRAKGWGATTSTDGTARGTLRVVGRGVDRGVFSPSLRSDKLRHSWGATRPDDVVVMCVGRLSREKNLGLIVEAFARLEGPARSRAHLVFVGDGPFRAQLQQLCLEAGVNAVFTGQLTGRGLGAAVASGDVLSSPSITETFGQVTLQGMAAGLPVVGLYVEGTADLVVHGVTGLLLD